MTVETGTVAPNPDAAPLSSGKGADAMQAQFAKIEAALASGETTWAKPTPDADLNGAPETPVVATETPIEAVSSPVQGADGKWRNADGSFAQDPAKPAVEAKADAPVVETPTDAEPIIVKLPGREEGQELEIEVSDPAIAERLQQLKNQSMWYSKYQEKSAKLEEEKAQIQARAAIIEASPESWAMELKPEQRLSTLRMLLAEHLEEVAPDIVKWVNDQTGTYERRLFLAEQKPKVEQAKNSYTQQVEQQRLTNAIIQTVDGSFPEGLSEAENHMVWDALAPHFKRLAEKGVAINPKNVLELGEPVFRAFAFLNATNSPPTVNGTPQKGQPAAAPKVAPEAQDKRKAREKAIAVARERSRHVAPPGSGVTPAQPPLAQALKGKSIREKFAFLEANNAAALRTGASGA